MRLLYTRKEEEEVDLLIAKHNSTPFFVSKIMDIRANLYIPQIIPRNIKVND